jgi:2-C-methyl-D-erythritol 4-phosphate cytidylyltransferase/2-C-methyl-D-erythritol 2,4-cyclodiphosphate synthase
MGGLPKQFRILGGRPLWRWSAAVAEDLYSRGRIDELVLVLPQGCAGEIAGDLACPVVYAPGGRERTDSVINSLEVSSSEYVMIHDAARPFLDVRICLDLMDVVSDTRGAIPLLPSVDSLKRVDGDVITVIPRESVYRTQTPQAFRRAPLLEALSRSGSATDEASVWLTASGELARVPGDEKNFKITSEFDWLIARSIADRREIRTGYGYDVHELIPGRRLVLGGLEIPSPLGLLGHSDADVLCHAISDALLGAAGRGDIGTLFPAADERYRDIKSTVIMERVLESISENGWEIVWIDATLVAQVPRLGSLLSEVLHNLGTHFTVYRLMDKMNIKVKSGEYVGGVGRAEYMACHAVATIQRSEE